MKITRTQLRRLIQEALEPPKANNVELDTRHLEDGTISHTGYLYVKKGDFNKAGDISLMIAGKQFEMQDQNSGPDDPGEFDLRIFFTNPFSIGSEKGDYKESESTTTELDPDARYVIKLSSEEIGNSKSMNPREDEIELIFSTDKLEGKISVLIDQVAEAGA